jgi:YD repeat-containing protein
MDGESTLEITETSPAEKSVFKKFVRFDERFNPAEISVGTTESKNEKPETLHIRVFYEDADNPDTPTKILDQNDKPLYITPEAFNRIEEIFRVKEAEKMGQPPNVEDYLAERKDSFGENKTLTIRDKQGLIKKFVYSDGSTGEISYDNAGRYVRLIEKTSASKREERYSYDWLGRVTLVRRVEENGEIRKASNEYDATDLFDETAKYAVNKTGFDGAKTQLLYNKAGLLWNIVKYQAKGPSVTTYEYDAFGNPVRVLLPDGCEIRATYDSRDRLINIVVPSRLFDSWKDYKMGHLIHRE